MVIANCKECNIRIGSGTRYGSVGTARYGDVFSSPDTRGCADHRRLKELETQMADVNKGTSVLCQTQLALLNHALIENNIERRCEEMDQLNDYLVNR